MTNEKNSQEMNGRKSYRDLIGEVVKGSIQERRKILLREITKYGYKPITQKFSCDKQRGCNIIRKLQEMEMKGLLYLPITMALVF